MSDQANSSQAALLATAVYSYATQIDNLPALKVMVERIAHRHVQTHVLPEQYPILGECLLQAMKDVLGKQLQNPRSQLGQKLIRHCLLSSLRENMTYTPVFLRRRHPVYSCMRGSH